MIFMGLDHSIGVRNRNGISSEETLIIFRKFNALQGYMEREFDVNNNVDTIIPYHAIHHLNEVSQTILQSKSDEVSSKLLPYAEGFFYGSTEYDEYYYEDMKRLYDTTALILEKYQDSKYRIVYWCWW